MIKIHRGLVMSGDVTASGGVVLEGRLLGRVTAPRLVIGPDGYLEGDAEVDELIVEGQIVGTVHARSVRLLASALVEGDVHHEALEIEKGAVLVGDTVHVPVMETGAGYRHLQNGLAAEDEQLRLWERAVNRIDADVGLAAE